MFYSGIADEAGKDLATQIKAHRELGWQHIELRLIEGAQFTDISDAEFESALAALTDAGIQISCFASPIANWATKITDPLDNDVAILERAMPRMRQAGCEFIRVMSWPNDGLADDDWHARAVARMQELAKRAEEGGVTLVLENCDGWTATSAAAYGAFFDEVGSNAFKAVFDTGNAAAHKDPDPWAWYVAAKPHIAYIHIKNTAAPASEGEEPVQVYPDVESPCRIREMLADVLAGGYDGGFSIEPHMAAAIHAGKDISDAEAAYQIYTAYGRKAMQLIADLLD